jgi:putative heme-binding domain-containing protein
MRRPLFTFFFAAWILQCQAFQGQQETHNPRTAPEDVAAGSKTFRSHCAVCHGYNGEGGRGPNLAAGEFHHGSSDADLLANISNGIPGTEMPGIYYQQDKVWQIVAFVRSLHADPEKPTGDPARGESQFQAKGCAGCHRVHGQGEGLGPDLSSIGGTRSLAHLRQSLVDPEADLQPRYWRAKFKDPAGKTVEGFVLNEDTYNIQVIDMNQRLHSYDKPAIKDFTLIKRSPMPSYRETLSAGELNDLVAFLSSLRGL